MRAHWPLATLLLIYLVFKPAQAQNEPLSPDEPLAPDESWRTISPESAAVTVWVNEVSEPFQSVRAQVTVAAPIGPLLSLLQDAQQQHQWLPYTHQVTVLEQPTPHATLVQFFTERRWPFKARDAITLFTVVPEGPNQIRIHMENRPEARPAASGFLRAPTAAGYWLLTALPECQTQVLYESGSRWGGLIPQWLVNQTNARLAGEALLNLSQWAPLHYQEYTAYGYLETSTVHRHCR